MRGIVHHIDLTVRDLDASRAFYAAVLEFLGYKLGHSDARGCDFDLVGGGAFQSIGIKRANEKGATRRHDRYSPGLHHLAWTAASRDDVDRLWMLLQQIGADVLDPPKEYPQYGSGYYAVFFADPDGIKLEYVFHPAEA